VRRLAISWRIVPTDWDRTYMISGSIIDYFYTQIIGDPTNLPVIKATADFPTDTTLGLIDGNRYGADGLGWKAVNVFFRQIRNLILDTTNIPAEKNAVGLHWPSAQATAVSNVVFRLSYQPGTQHVGMFMEEGSGGLLNDLVFYGGLIGAKLGNQQYTSRNWTFYNSKTAIHQIWNWGWTYKSINIIDCDVGIDMPDTETASITLIDSYFARIKTAAIRTARNPPNSQPPAAGSLIMENVIFDKVPNVLVSPDHTILVGSATQAARVKGYAMVGSVVRYVSPTSTNHAQGNVYDPEGPKLYQGNDPEYFPVPRALLSVSGHKYYERSKVSAGPEIALHILADDL
jgi:glucan 1,3-beta-glucosidase